METESITTAEVLALKEQHVETWRKKDDGFWFVQLSEEIGQLGHALTNPKGNPDLQLRRIASIALNWLEKRADKE